MGSIFWAGSEKPGKLFPSLQRILCRSESVWYLAACLYPDMGCWIAYWRTQSRLVVHNQLFQITTSFSVSAKIYCFWGIKMALESCKKKLNFVWTWIFTKYVCTLFFWNRERPLMTSHVFWPFLSYLVLLYNVRFLGLSWTPYLP